MRNRMHTHLDAATLREILLYDADTGVFTRRVRCGPHKPGIMAGFLHAQTGYVRVRVASTGQHQAHRLAWLYVHGKWPDGQIDHINCIRHDNRIENLRDVSQNINMQNKRGAHKNNACGLLGVRKRKADGMYYACIGFNGKRAHSVAFDTPERAHTEYLAMKSIHHAGYAP